jgi:hypothetical protein
MLNLYSTPLRSEADRMIDDALGSVLTATARNGAAAAITSIMTAS